MPEQSLPDFIKYCAKHIKGDEKGEAQIFMDHFFTALGYEEGLKGAGAECEFRIRNDQRKSTSFADLVWKPRVLIEMKKRGEDLSLHYQQAFSYWMQLVPHRPQYVILCNFDEFWIYDFNVKLYDPVDTVNLTALLKRKQAFAFLFPEKAKPVFASDREDVTEEAAKKIASVYKHLCKRDIKKEHALQYCLQCIVAMFAEDTGLLPEKIFFRHR
ncbi:MAG: type IIL restriction-modification enzyme MmeI [Bacteroidota bacterium]